MEFGRTAMTAQVNSLLQQTPKREDAMHGEKRLTRRERQVLHLIGKGKTTKEIAAILNLSTGTIGNHRKSICRKWNIHSTAELVYRAGLGNYDST